jgi:hypothetical protein
MLPYQHPIVIVGKVLFTKGLVLHTVEGRAVVCYQVGFNIASHLMYHPGERTIRKNTFKNQLTSPVCAFHPRILNK